MDRHPRTRCLDRLRHPPRRQIPADRPPRRRRRLSQRCRPPRGRPVSEGGLMKWVTRARPKTDRIACPWLIRRFIDRDAEILYVPRDDVLSVAADHDAYSFDTPGATFDHREGRCTFEVLIDHFDL